MSDPRLLESIRRDAEEVLAVRPPRTALLGVQAALTAAFVLVFYLATPLWAQSPRLYEILFERFIWPHAIVFVAMVALADLATKLLAAWLAGWSAPEIPGLGAGELTPERLAQAAAALRKNSEDVWYRRQTVRNRRLAMALLQFARGDSKDSVRETLRGQAELDEVALASRYTLVKLYLWAIPLLGFIGTVEGIGAGIGQFSVELEQQTRLEEPAGEPGSPPGERAAGSLERVRGSLQNVTGGLGRAFDTTYLALVLAVILMILMSVLEKLETDRQLEFDEYCQAAFAALVAAAPGIDPGDLERLEKAAAAVESASERAGAAAAGLAGLGDSVDRLTGALGGGLDLELKVRRKEE